MCNPGSIQVEAASFRGWFQCRRLSGSQFILVLLQPFILPSIALAKTACSPWLPFSWDTLPPSSSLSLLSLGTVFEVYVYSLIFITVKYVSGSREVA